MLVTTILAAFTVLGGAIYALAARLGTQMDRHGDRIEAVGADLGQRIDATSSRFDGVIDQLTGVRAGLAGLDSRVATIERRLDLG